MYEILKAIAAGQDWVFDYGRTDFQNLFKAAERKEVSHIFLDPVKIRDINNEFGVVEKQVHSGSFMILYSSDLDKKTYDDRYQEYIKPIVLNNLDTIKTEFRCGHEANFSLWEIVEVINVFDHNFDGVIVTYQIELDYEETSLIPNYGDLSFFWNGNFEGNNLINEAGLNIPYISGAGLDAVFDFGVLNDDRFDKGAYVGNLYGLAENFKFPFVDIYYDDTSEATRKHWKLTDFNYSNILFQSILLDNQFFLKAIATNDTENKVSRVQKLLVYENEQSGENLVQLKDFMNLQSDFYFEKYVSDWSLNEDAWTSNINVVTAGNKDNIEDDFSLIKNNCLEIKATASGSVPRTYRANLLTVGKKYKGTFTYLIPTGQATSGGRIYLNNASTVGLIFNDVGIWKTVSYEFVAIAAFNQVNIGNVTPAINDLIYLSDWKFEELVENYYKS